MATVYAETNFLIALARGQDPDAPRLLSLPPAHRLAMPAVCVMEAMATYQKLRSDHNAFWGQNSTMGQRGRELGRDRTSPAAATALYHVEQATVAADRVIGDVRDRLTTAIEAVARTADLLTVDPAILSGSIRAGYLEQMTDNLILHAVLADAPTRSGPKALLTGNVKDFGDPDVVRLLAAAGITGPFRTAAQVLGWLSTAGPT